MQAFLPVIAMGHANGFELDSHGAKGKVDKKTVPTLFK